MASDQLPKVSYLTLLDKYMMFVGGTVIVLAAETLIVSTSDIWGSGDEEHVHAARLSFDNAVLKGACCAYVLAHVVLVFVVRHRLAERAEGLPALILAPTREDLGLDEDDTGSGGRAKKLSLFG
jgi:hypothetical protein